MAKPTEATTRLTPAEAYAQHAQRVRRQAAIDRMTAVSRAETQRVLDLYANGSLKRKQEATVPTYTEAATFTTVKLPGGVKASKAATKAAATRRKRELDMSPEAVARREKRRAQRAARKAKREAAAQG